jgi:plasmid maintenance system antidote protein VapI
MKRITTPPGPLELWQLLDLIRARVADTSQKELAITLGVSPQYLSDILHGRRAISTNVAKSLGFRKETTEQFWPISREVKP